MNAIVSTRYQSKACEYRLNLLEVEICGKVYLYFNNHMFIEYLKHCNVRKYFNPHYKEKIENKKVCPSTLVENHISNEFIRQLKELGINENFIITVKLTKEQSNKLKSIGFLSKNQSQMRLYRYELSELILDKMLIKYIPKEHILCTKLKFGKDKYDKIATTLFGSNTTFIEPNAELMDFNAYYKSKVSEPEHGCKSLFNTGNEPKLVKLIKVYSDGSLEIEEVGE